MYIIEEQFLHQLLMSHSRSIVGRLCKQNELIKEDNSLSEAQKLDLLKSFNRELIYETSRDLENQIKCYIRGKVYEKFNLYTPTKTDQSE